MRAPSRPQARQPSRCSSLHCRLVQLRGFGERGLSCVAKLCPFLTVSGAFRAGQDLFSIKPIGCCGLGSNKCVGACL